MPGAQPVSWRLAVAATAGLITLFSFQQWMGTPRREVDLETSFALQTIAWGLWLLLLPLIVRVARRHPLEGRPTAGWVIRSAGEGLAFVLLHTTLAATVRWFTGLSISSTWSATVANSLLVGFATNCLRYSAILGAYQAVAYHHTVREREQRAMQLEAELARAKLATVEACLRPHFLFNTLNAIAALVREDPRTAERMIGDLSDLLRASLGADPSREVRLEDELTFTSRYLDLERVRFQDRLRVIVNASAEAREALVPHLMLQPLVENAVRHGIAPLEDGGSIVVSAARRDGVLELSVTDDGVGLNGTTLTDGAGIALQGLRTRLAHLYGDRHRFGLHAGTPKGTIVRIEIPYRSGAV
jgi:two-component system, LytTR family, sensor kinase